MGPASHPVTVAQRRENQRIDPALRSWRCVIARLAMINSAAGAHTLRLVAGGVAVDWFFLRRAADCN
jgi:hypothetical protein